MSILSSLINHVIVVIEKELLNTTQPIVDLIISEIELLIKKLEQILESHKSQKLDK